MKNNPNSVFWNIPNPPSNGIALIIIGCIMFLFILIFFYFQIKRLNRINKEQLNIKPMLTLSQESSESEKIRHPLDSILFL